MVINGGFFNTIIQNMDNGKDLESYCKYEKLNLIEIRRKANEDLKSRKIGLLKRCSMLISKLLH
ncbi:hypothetical protein J1C67_16580 [Clostridium gasigenes]|uniref:hypothetical protein n=1 Tax=Clostridium gasigenes TaxID=94869 RepID=UPI0014386109|nr:hypothetical protein [Clostridium gasigenes]NKF05698.1 hypothetical protein [Clostridium gasigenes]QSW19131.1 hypothetical protein J1C67_16580 [Clostridium gasigenes]